MRHPGLADIVRRDPRYDYQAYEFVYQALRHTQELLGKKSSIKPGEEKKENHVSGRQLVEGIRDYALREFGMMARAVFKVWGINETVDFGNIVYNLIDAQLMSRTPEDTLADFAGIFDMENALVRDYQFDMKEAE